MTEGIVVWLGGLGFLVLIAMWLTARRKDPSSARITTLKAGDH